jgi:hypothetical protein
VLWPDGARARLERIRLPGLAVFETARTPEGLFGLRRLGPPEPQDAADLAGEFWRRFFLWRLAAGSEEAVRQAWAALAGTFPRLAVSLRASLPGLGRGLVRLSRERGQSSPLAHGVAPFWGLLASQLEMSGQNADLSPAWEAEALSQLERLAAILSAAD